MKFGSSLYLEPIGVLSLVELKRQASPIVFANYVTVASKCVGVFGACLLALHIPCERIDKQCFSNYFL